MILTVGYILLSLHGKKLVKALNRKEAMKLFFRGGESEIFPLQIQNPRVHLDPEGKFGISKGLFYDVIDNWLNLTEPSMEKLAKAKSGYKNG